MMGLFTAKVSTLTIDNGGHEEEHLKFFLGEMYSCFQNHVKSTEQQDKKDKHANSASDNELKFISGTDRISSKATKFSYNNYDENRRNKYNNSSSNPIIKTGNANANTALDDFSYCGSSTNSLATTATTTTLTRSSSSSSSYHYDINFYDGYDSSSSSSSSINSDGSESEVDDSSFFLSSNHIINKNRNESLENIECASDDLFYHAMELKSLHEINISPVAATASTTTTTDEKRRNNTQTDDEEEETEISFEYTKNQSLLSSSNYKHKSLSYCYRRIYDFEKIKAALFNHAISLNEIIVPIEEEVEF